jgi:hypothetical protein
MQVGPVVELRNSPQVTHEVSALYA